MNKYLFITTFDDAIQKTFDTREEAECYASLMEYTEPEYFIKEQNNNPDVIVIVRGGVVVGVFSTIDGLSVHVNDYDNNENIIDVGCNYTMAY